MSVLTLLITSEATQSERRFGKEITIAQLKEKLEVVCGVSSQNMKLELFNTEGHCLGVMAENDKMLGYYPAEQMYRINVVDLDPYRVKGEYTDVSRVEKFELDDKEYDKRTDTVREYFKRNKLGKYADKKEEAIDEKLLDDRGITVGQRCQVEIEEGGMKRLGSVKFVGFTNFKPGVWIGVEYDEPVGKHNGTVEGKKYFEAKAKHGGLVRAEKVTVGDFPEEDPFADDDLEEM